MKLWIARDKDGSLYLWCGEPVKSASYEIFSGIGRLVMLSDEQFPEVTWENSPQEVELKLIKQQ